MPAQAVTLARLCTLMDGAHAERASARSAELKGLLHELQREHSCNRALMQIELGFLDHLMGMLAMDGANGYDTQRLLDVRSRGRAPTAPCTSSTCAPRAMSIPTLQGLQTALSGLLAEQQALDIDRPQHRQREHRRLLARDGRAGAQPADLDPRALRSTGKGAQLGTGVTVDDDTPASATPTSTPSTARRTAR